MTVARGIVSWRAYAYVRTYVPEFQGAIEWCIRRASRPHCSSHKTKDLERLKYTDALSVAQNVKRKFWNTLHVYVRCVVSDTDLNIRTYVRT